MSHHFAPNYSLQSLVDEIYRLCQRRLDNVTLVTWSNSSGMLGKANHTKVGHDNQLSAFGPGWITLANRTCNSWRWTVGMEGGPYGKAVGSAGWNQQGFEATAGIEIGLPCTSGDFICVEMAVVP